MTHPNDPVAAMPAATVFDFRFGERDGSTARVALPVRPEFLQGEQRVHGGILATLADTAAVFLLIEGVAAEEMLTSIEFKLNFLRPAELGRGDVTALAKIVRRGRQVALVEVDLEQGDAHVAKGLFTYLIAPRREPKR